MYTRQELKSMAKEQIRGKIGQLFLVMLVMFLLTSVAAIANGIPVVGQLAYFAFISTLLNGLILMFINMTKGAEPDIRCLFERMSNILKIFGLHFMISLFVGLWSLLFVIPGLIKAYSYSLAPYIMAENPEKGVFEAINESKQIMNGHKMERFVLDLSFIGWAILVSITFGIAGIYVFPYMQATYANFYNNVKLPDVQQYGAYGQQYQQQGQYQQPYQQTNTGGYDSANYSTNDPSNGYSNTDYYQQQDNSVDDSDNDGGYDGGYDGGDSGGDSGGDGGGDD